MPKNTQIPAEFPLGHFWTRLVICEEEACTGHVAPEATYHRPAPATLHQRRLASALSRSRNTRQRRPDATCQRPVPITQHQRRPATPRNRLPDCPARPQRSRPDLPTPSATRNHPKSPKSPKITQINKNHPKSPNPPKIPRNHQYPKNHPKQPKPLKIQCLAFENTAVGGQRLR